MSNRVTERYEANKYLSMYYLPTHNKKFALQIQENSYEKLPEKAKIDDFAYEITERKVANN